MTDTTTEAVERLAYERECDGQYLTADTLRALAQERDAACLRAEVENEIANEMKASGDAARAEVKTMRKALKAARQFIRNGVEFGFIRMPDPDTPDSAHDTLPMIEAALAAKEGGQ